MSELHTATALITAEVIDTLEIPSRRTGTAGLRKLTLAQVKAYIKATGVLTLQGGTDLSANPNYPAATKGDVYYCTVTGKIGGASGVTLDVGDAYVASADNAGGTQAGVGASWFVLEHNLVSALMGALASTTEVLTGTDSAKVTTPAAIAALWKKSADVASASTVTFGDGGYFFVTGTTTITALALSTDLAGRHVWVKFAGVLTLTNNATSLILPTGANITTAAGDTALFVSEGSGNFRCLAYNRAGGGALGTLAPANNLSDVSNAQTSRTNLGVNRRIFLMTLAGTALASSEILLSITPVGDETLTFAGNMSNSTGKKQTGGTNPGSTFTGNINKNNSSVGTWVISTSGVVTFTTTSGAAITVAPGDILEFVGPSSVSTALGFMFSLIATVSF